MLYYIRHRQSPSHSYYLCKENCEETWGIIERRFSEFKSFKTKNEAQEVMDANNWTKRDYSIVNTTFINNLKKKLEETGSCDELFTLSSNRKWFEDYINMDWIYLTTTVKTQLMLGRPITDLTILDEKGKRVYFTLSKIELTY